MTRITAGRVLLSGLLCGLAGFASGQAGKQSESDEAVKKEVLKVGDPFDAAREAKDRPAIERILADGLTWTARGDRLNKTQLIADIFSNNFHFISFAHDNVTARVFGDTVLVTGHSTSVLMYKGKRFDAPRLFTDVYVKMDGRWQLVGHHVSELAKP
jgi:ketosteroid isomerase-like protein